jgi:hypothetical protein
LGDLTDISVKIKQASELLDVVAKDISRTGFVEKKSWIKLIGRALCELIELQRGIYIKQPELKPEELNDEPYDKKANREFGNILIGLPGILSKNKPTEAIEILEDYLSNGPPDYLANMARNEIQKIKDDFNV